MHELMHEIHDFIWSSDVASRRICSEVSLVIWKQNPLTAGCGLECLDATEIDFPGALWYLKYRRTMRPRSVVSRNNRSFHTGARSLELDFFILKNPVRRGGESSICIDITSDDILDNISKLSVSENLVLCLAVATPWLAARHSIFCTNVQSFNFKIDKTKSALNNRKYI